VYTVIINEEIIQTCGTKYSSIFIPIRLGSSLWGTTEYFKHYLVFNGRFVGVILDTILLF